MVGALGGELNWTPEEAPSLNYRIQCEGGTYTLWMLSKFNVREEGFFGVGVDSEILAKEEVYGKDSLWRYEADLVYRWVLAAQIQLTHGGACAAYICICFRYDI